MNLLQVSKTINTELTQISLYYRDVLDSQDAVAIFNSVITCITDDLANTFKFIVSDCRDTSHIFTRWEYDLSNKHHIDRTGQDLQDILLLLKQLPSGTAQLICDVEWSSRFFEMDKASQERLFRSTYWGKKTKELQKKSPPTMPSGRSPQEPAYLLDLQPLELDLLKMETETKYFDKRTKDAIYESAKICIQAGYCRGIHFEMLDSDDRLTAEWGFEVSPELKLVRTGDNPEQVLAILRKRGNLHLKISAPLVTRKFDELPTKEKQEVMKDTIWASFFKKKGWFG